MIDDDLVLQAQEGRKAFIQALRQENQRKKDELAAQTALGGPEPVDWRQRSPQREAEPAPTLRQTSLNDDQRDEVRALVREMLAGERDIQRIEREEERERTNRRIAAAQCEFLAQVSKVLDDIDHALIKAAEKFERVDEGQQHLRREIAEVRTLAASEDAKLIDDCTCSPSRPLRKAN